MTQIYYLNGVPQVEKYFWDYGDECPICGCHYPYLQKDHIIPRGECGTDNLDNIEYICPNCHWLKTHDDISRASSKYWATEEAKQEQSKRHKGNQHAKGMKHSEETKAHLSEVLKGRPKPEGHGQHVSEATKGVPKSEQHRNAIAKAQDRPEVKEAQSKAKLGNAWNIGRVASEETRKLLSEKAKGNKSNLGHTMSEEQKHKISASNSGNKSRTGQVMSEEERSKHSESAKRYWANVRAERYEELELQAKIDKLEKQLGLQETEE